MTRRVLDLLAQGDDVCMEPCPDGVPYMCSLRRGHEGEHVAEVADDRWEFAVERARWPRRSKAN